MFTKYVKETDTSEYVFAFGFIYAVSALSINVGFFINIGYDYSILFSSIDLFVVNMFVIKNILVVSFIILITIPLIMLLLKKGYLPRIVNFINNKTDIIEQIIVDREFRYLILTGVLIVGLNVALVISPKYFLFHVFIGSSIFYLILYKTWRAFVDGKIHFGFFSSIISILSIMISASIGWSWASAVKADDAQNIYVTAEYDAGIICLQKRILRSSSEGVLFWSPTGSYIDFVPWSRIGGISNLPCTGGIVRREKTSAQSFAGSGTLD